MSSAFLDRIKLFHHSDHCSAERMWYQQNVTDGFDGHNDPYVALFLACATKNEQLKKRKFKLNFIVTSCAL